jgi:hypothetical protein
MRAPGVRSAVRAHGRAVLPAGEQPATAAEVLSGDERALVDDLSSSRRGEWPFRSGNHSKSAARCSLKIGKLRDAGVVTAEEFEARKAELLGRI